MSEVASRLGVSEPTLRNWVKKYGSTSSQHHTINDQQEELMKLKAELRRVTEERDILKESTAFFAAESKKIRVHKVTTQEVLCFSDVPPEEFAKRVA